MKYNFIKSLVLITGLSFVACTNVEDDTSFSSVNKPTLSVVDTDLTVMEGDDIVLNFTSDFQISMASDIKVDLLFNDTADANDVMIDLETATLEIEAWGPNGYKFSYPGFTDTYSLTIGSATLDALADGGDHFQIKISSMGNMYTKVDDNTQIIDVTITTVPDILVMELDWAYGYVDGAGDEVDLDFDIEVYDGGFGFYDYSYDYHPERVIFDNSTPDDTYYVLAELWSTNGAVASTDPIPSTMTFNKDSWSESVDLTSYFNTADGGLGDGNGSAYVMFVVTKTGNYYEVEDDMGNPIASGRLADIANIIGKGKNKR